jgi:uncharacterized tellurite resistance protein B-like protein
MTASTGSTSDDTTPSGFADEIRSTLTRLDALDRKTAGYIKSLACILHRVAMADDDLCDREVARMEQILIDHAGLTPPEAMLTVEIAKHCRKIADCGSSYEASRKLRATLDDRQGRCIHRFLHEVAQADGRVLTSETAQIRQIAVELGLPS